MIRLVLENINSQGEIVERKFEDFATADDCIDRVEQLVVQDPSMVYASEHLLRRHGLPISEKLELRGTVGWEIRGVISNDEPEERRKVAEYLGGIVDTETENAKQGRRIRMTGGERLKMRREAKRLWQRQ